MIDRQGWTPFHYAARRGVSPRAAAALHERGVDPRRKAKDGARPIDVARANKRLKLVAWLEAFDTVDDC